MGFETSAIVKHLLIAFCEQGAFAFSNKHYEQCFMDLFRNLDQQNKIERIQQIEILKENLTSMQ